MANSYHQIYIQTVIVTKYRKALIQKEWKSEFMGVIGNLINETGCKTIIINGVEDHVHCFLGLKPTHSVSDLMKSVKSKSSGWLNKSNHLPHRFEWQPGYGVFSYSRSHIDRVFKYIQNQEEHHKKMTFKEEYILLLESFGIEYDERYIFSEPK